MKSFLYLVTICMIFLTTDGSRAVGGADDDGAGVQRAATPKPLPTLPARQREGRFPDFDTVESDVTFTQPLTEETVNGTYAFFLNRLSIYRTIGRDRMAGLPWGEEEGSVLMTVGDQETTLFWKAHTLKAKKTPNKRSIEAEKRKRKRRNESEKKREKREKKRIKKSFNYTPRNEQRGMLLYLGNDERLNLSVHIVETDKEDSERFLRAVNVISELAKGFSPLAGVFQPQVEGAASFISSLGKTIVQHMDHEDPEMKYSTQIIGKPMTGEYRIFRGDKDDPDIDLVFSVRALEDLIHPEFPISKAKQVRVVLRKFHCSTDVAKAVKKGKGNLSFELVVGGQTRLESVPASALHRGVLSLENVPLYTGPWSGVLPISCSLITTRNIDAQLKALITTVKNIKDMVPPSSTSDKIFTVTDTVSDAVLAGFAPRKKIKLHSIEKALINQAQQNIYLDVFKENKIVGPLGLEVEVEEVVLDDDPSAYSES